jgi:hypothetical protein
MTRNTTAAAISPDLLPLRDMSAARAAIQVPSAAAAIAARPAAGARRGNVARSVPGWPATLGSVSLSAVLWTVPAAILGESDLRALALGLVANPLQHLPYTAAILAFVLVYSIAAGCFIVASTSRLTQAGPRFLRVLFFLLVTPAILLSLVGTLVSTLALSLVFAIWCLPALL